MNFFKALLLLVVIFFIGELSNSWAMFECEVEDKIKKLPKKRKKSSKSLTNEVATKNKLPPPPPSKKKRIHASAPALSTPVSSFSNSPQRALFDQFKEIVESKPYPLPTITEITAAQEDKEGSRKWVKFFNDPTDKESHEWHQNMSEIIAAFREENHKERYFPVETNFAVARLVFVLQDGNHKIVDIPHFFASGWPATANRNSAQKFAKALADEKLGDTLKNFKNYGLRFITKSYQGDVEKSLRSSHYDPFKDEIKEIMEKELEGEDSIPTENRLQTHLKIMNGNHPNILAKLYFHSEQSIWMAVKDEIEKFKKSLKRRSSSDIRSIFNKPQELPQSDLIDRVFVDICSFYDMCWCCGDTLTSCCHTNTLGAQAYIRASGCSAYYDRPFITKPPYSLRDHREEFLGYEEGRAFQMLINGDESSSYKPYIAHSIVRDFQ